MIDTECVDKEWGFHWFAAGTCSKSVLEERGRAEDKCGGEGERGPEGSVNRVETRVRKKGNRHPKRIVLTVVQHSEEIILRKGRNCRLEG